MTPPRVLVTRSSQGGSDLAEHLRVLGAHPVLIPAIEIVDPTSFTALNAALADLASFGWLLFTSANAVEVFGRRVLPRRENISIATVGDTRQQLPRKLKVAAIGPATARALEKIGLAPDLVPPQAVAESLTEALLPHARQRDGAPTRFLLIRAEEARELLPETLRAAGAEVTVAPAYRTVVPANSVALLRNLLAFSADGVDRAPGEPLAAITFTSASTARNLLTLAEVAGVSLPESARRISIGPITSATLRDLGLPPHAEAPEATVAALAATVMRSVAQQPIADD